jgi:hypothetical protein
VALRSCVTCSRADDINHLLDQLRVLENLTNPDLMRSERVLT